MWAKSQPVTLLESQLSFWHAPIKIRNSSELDTMSTTPTGRSSQISSKTHQPNLTSQNWIDTSYQRSQEWLNSKLIGMSKMFRSELTPCRTCSRWARPNRSWVVKSSSLRKVPKPRIETTWWVLPTSNKLPWTSTSSKCDLNIKLTGKMTYEGVILVAQTLIMNV